MRSCTQEAKVLFPIDINDNFGRHSYLAFTDIAHATHTIGLLTCFAGLV